MRYRRLVLGLGAGRLGSAVTAQTSQLVCENWHPRLGQIDDIRIAIDVQRRTCNGHPCKITDAELS
jgi:hypothetical protein